VPAPPLQTIADALDTLLEMRLVGYLKDFAPHLYYETDAGMATVFVNLMSQWRTEQKSAGPAGA
jgi:hypothetical protein